MVSNDYLLKGRITSGLVRFAVPVMLSMILQILYSAVDLLIVGNFATTADLSGVAVSSQILTTVTLGISGITTGLTVLLGQFSGAGSEKDVKHTVGSSVLLYGVLTILLTVLLVCFNDAIVSAMKTSAGAVEETKSYLLICSLGIIFIVGYNVTSGIFRGLGNSKTPLYFVAVACVINIGLDLLFVKGFGMGAAGAALATVIAQAGSFLFSLLYLKKKGVGIRFSRHDFWPSRADLHLRLTYIKKMLRIGLPISLQEVLINLSFLLITAVVNKIGQTSGMGEVPSAAVGTVEKLISFLMMPTMAISVAVATMSAHNYGARQVNRSKKCLKSGILISLAIAIPACLFCWVFGTALTSLFSRDPVVIREASLYLKTYSLDCVAVAFVFNLNSFFSSLSKSVFSMAHSLLTTFLIRVPFVIIAGGMAGVTLLTIGCAAPLSSLGSMIICFVYYGWLVRRMKDDQEPENSETMSCNKTAI